MICAHRLGLWAVLRLKPPKPQLEDGSVYRQNRPTQLDKTKNLYLEVRSEPVARPCSPLRPSYPSRAARRVLTSCRFCNGQLPSLLKGDCVCPRCGLGVLQIIDSRRDPFWGCTEFRSEPSCRYKKDIESGIIHKRA